MPDGRDCCPQRARRPPPLPPPPCRRHPCPRKIARECTRGEESLNAEAGKFQHLAAHPGQCAGARPWFRDTGVDTSGTIAAGRVGANQIKTAPHRWRWREIGPYLDRIADIARTPNVSPIEFASAAVPF